MNTFFTGGYKSIQLVGLGLMAVLMLMAWAHYSGQVLLKQQTLLVDNVMDLKASLIEVHYLIHEETERVQGPLDKAYVMSLITRLNASADFLNSGMAQMGRLSGNVSTSHISKASIRDLKVQLESLLHYLKKNHAILNRDQHEDIIHDALFIDAGTIAEEIDDQVHEGVAVSVEQQTNVFIGLFLLSFLIFVGLFVSLKRSNQEMLLMLQKSKQLSQALEHSGEAAIVASTDGDIEFVNSAFCQMTGYSVEETLGNKASMISSGKQNKPFYEKLWATISGGRVWRGELVNRRKDGSQYPALMTIAPIFNHLGSITHYVANQRDMTDHKAMEEQLFQAQKLEAIGTLAGGIAHDFNNTLAAITGNLYLLKKHPYHQGDVLARAKVIEGVCEQAAIHIKQLLSYARNDSVLMNTVELNQCVKNACQMASVMVPATIELKFVSHEQELYVYWNETQVQQILINLINNARHALKGIEHACITLEIRVVDNDESLMRSRFEMIDKKLICLSIKDNGCGMPKHVMERIFDPFFTTKDPGEGTGLGLSMAFGAIQQAGGCVTVDSELGSGSEFEIWLPIDFKTDLGKDAEEVGICQGHGETVLIVDDEPELLLVQKEMVESFGYIALTASNGLEAVEIFEKYADDIRVVILDQVMPGLTGVKAAAEMLRIQPDSKFILVTGYDREDALDGDSSSFDAPVIYKPYNPGVMSYLIYEQINRRGIRFNT